MQYDMHYYGTYAMAAAAGIPKADAEIIAYSAQTVDDQNFEDLLAAETGEGVYGIATAHHPLATAERSLSRFARRDEDDCRLVWVPFHFLPGNQGVTFKERVVARQDSQVAQEMMDHFIQSAAGPFALQSIGVAAHTYADTFSHYGFSGIESRLNCVDPDSIVTELAHHATVIGVLKEKWSAFEARFGAAPELGHGAVLTYPDQPYLEWSFTYVNGTKESRKNQQTYFQACSRLYEYFMSFAKARYGQDTAPAVSFSQIEERIRAVLAYAAEAPDRVEQWKTALRDWGVYGIEVCRDYQARNDWLDDLVSRTGHLSFEELQAHPAFGFYRAATRHRDYVLRDLLPKFDILVA
ncbi:DUF6765 family protein [Paraburkholderia elongata]|uniref:Uncharacterized protein n=1 Tax=Paraburkholderia elongata TaxID=2675747 RepID=A0A972P2V7_9BURK|nr:DUF6765 family protein [Paraburkholderia elongata]NPT58192.1 hypothetical protein [Paraburkholderia elongata]NPT62120.1 hypothetical protein [Paraburkholderia elongata]